MRLSPDASGDATVRVGIVALLLASAALGQGPYLQTIQGIEGKEPLRLDLGAMIGDFDADGIPDFFGFGQNLSVPYQELVGYEVSVRSGSDLRVLHRREIPIVMGQRLAFLSALDWNGDGVSEVLCAEVAPNLRGEVKDIRTWQTLAVFPDLTGFCYGDPDFEPVDLAGFFADMNGDSVPDLVHTSACGLAAATTIRSGATGTIIRTLATGTQTYTRFRNLRAIADRTGDGIPELAYIREFPTSPRQFTIVDGMTGATLTASGFTTFSNYLRELHAGTADWNQDGIGDFLITRDSGSASVSFLTALSGADGAVLWSHTYGPSGYPELAAAIVPDQTGDNRAEVLTVHRTDYVPTQYPRVVITLRSGATGQVISSTHRSWQPETPTLVFPSSDHNGNGLADALVVYDDQGRSRLEVIDVATLTPIVSTVGKATGDRFGTKVFQQEFDGDGVLDLFLTAPGTRSGGSVFAYSGATGSFLARFDAPRDLTSFGRSLLVIDDLSGDGIRDVAVSAPVDDSPLAPLAGNLFLYSGSTGTLLREHPGALAYAQLGTSMALLSDLDGDGIKEVAIGAPHTAVFNSFTYTTSVLGPGRVFVVSPTTGAVICTMTAPQPRYGLEIHPVADHDADGHRDLLVVGFQYIFSNELTDHVQPLIHSTRTGLAVGGSAPFRPMGGRALHPMSDFNGDGLPELLSERPNNGSLPGFYLRSSIDLTTVAVYNDPVLSYPHVAFPLGDFQGDGVPEILIGLRTSFSINHESLFDGRTGALLGNQTTPQLFTGLLPPPKLLVGDALLPDRNQDGLLDWLLQRPSDSVNGVADVGQVHIVASLGFPAGTSQVGFGSGASSGPAPILAVYGGAPLRPNGLFALGISGVPANHVTQIFAGTLADPQGFPYLGATLHLDPAGMIFPLAPVVPLTTTSTDLVGRPFLLPIPGDSSLSGLTLHFQGIVFDPLAQNGLFATTNALSITIP